MKNRFLDNRPKTCGEDRSHQLTPKQQLEELNQERKRLKSKLKEHKSEMKFLKQMSNNYRYHEGHIAEFVGNCYMMMDGVKGELEYNSERIQKLKAK